MDERVMDEKCSSCLVLSNHEAACIIYQATLLADAEPFFDQPTM
jgi:hypothetical protein